MPLLPFLKKFFCILAEVLGRWSFVDNMMWQLLGKNNQPPKTPTTVAKQIPEAPVVAEPAPVAVTLYTFNQVHDALQKAKEEFPDKMNKQCVVEFIKKPIT